MFSVRLPRVVHMRPPAHVDRRVTCPGGILLLWLGLRAGISIPATGGFLRAPGCSSGAFSSERVISPASRSTSNPRNRRGGEVVMAYLIHGVHHAYPEDCTSLGDAADTSRCRSARSSSAVTLGSPSVIRRHFAGVRRR
jgi:hypothetical protein